MKKVETTTFNLFTIRNPLCKNTCWCSGSNSSTYGSPLPSKVVHLKLNRSLIRKFSELWNLLPYNFYLFVLILPFGPKATEHKASTVNSKHLEAASMSCPGKSLWFLDYIFLLIKNGSLNKPQLKMWVAFKKQMIERIWFHKLSVVSISLPKQLEMSHLYVINGPYF